MEELIRGNVRVELDYIGEGWVGDYDETDPHDERLLRFYVQRRVDGEWEDVEDASYCTALPETLTVSQQQCILDFLMDVFYSPVSMGVSVRRCAERMSWMSLKWFWYE